MGKKEVIREFVKKNWKIFASTEKMPHETFKKMKSNFFVEVNHNSVGVPKDKEIAYELIDYLFDINYFKTEDDLVRVLSLPFLSEHILDAQIFFERIAMVKQETTIDYRRLRELEYQKNLREEIKKEIIVEETRDIEEARRKKIAEYESLPSVLDIKEFQEPDADESRQTEESFLPWWRKLNLREDPFPYQQGLYGINDDLIERVVIKTEIFSKYAYFVKDEKEELFKDTIFLGPFGSGKTTLLDYLKKPLISNKIYPLSIQLVAEEDFHSFMIKFKKELLNELCRLYERLSGTRLVLEGTDIDEKILTGMSRVRTEFSPLGFLVFVDDLHKHRSNEEFQIVLKFLSNLQIFKEQLMKSLSNIKLSFYISGLPEWNQIIASDSMYSGSYSRREILPPITVEAAHEMLNKRLIAYSQSPEGVPAGGGVSIDYVQKIYRSLQYAKQDITYRSFISSVIDEFGKGNFTILKADPVHIGEDVILKIKSILESDRDLSSRINNLLFGGGIQKEEVRAKCLEVLVECYLNKGYSESDEYFQANPFYFQRLSRSRLIEKASSGSNYKWTICKPLFEQNKHVLAQLNLSLEDYLLHVYRLPVVRHKKTPMFHQELMDIDNLIPKCAESTKIYLKKGRDAHAELLEIMEKYETSMAPKDIVELCISAVCDLTNSITSIWKNQSIAKTAIDLRKFWTGFWFQPGELFELLNSMANPALYQENVWYICRLYRDAFTALLSFLQEELEKSRFMNIPITDLTNDEIREFHDIRSKWINRDYFSIVDKVTNLNELKLRKLLYNLFRLLYGDNQSLRLKHLDSESRKYVIENIKEASEKNLPTGDNEFEQLNRGNYKNFIIGIYNKQEGKRNWESLFKYVFAPMTEIELKEFLSDFSEFNISTTHKKHGSITAEIQSKIYAYILHSIHFVQLINKAYLKLIQEGLVVVDTKSTPRYAHYFCLGRNDARTDYSAIYINVSDAERINGIIEKKSIFSFDASDADFIESSFYVPYQIFIAYVARMLNQSAEERAASKRAMALRRAQGSIIEMETMSL
jgi:hypothetical protein